MYRSIFYLGLFLFVTGLLGLLLGDAQSSLVFLLPKGAFAAFGLGLGAVLMHFAIFDMLRGQKTKVALGVVGALLLGVGILGVLSPDYLGLVQTGYVRIANLMFTFVGGSGSLLAALEEDRESLGSEVLSLAADRLRSSKTKLLKQANRHKKANL